MKTVLDHRVLLGMIGMMGLSCARPSAPTRVVESGALEDLIRSSQSGDRDQWLPAVQELGQLAASDSAIRDKIWSEARVNTVGMKFVQISPGSFIQGPGRHASIHVAHPVEITQEYFIAATEVTNAQFQALFPDFEAVARFPPHPDSPVGNVSWEAADRFCKLLSEREGAHYRLPTEAEWEYACRAGSDTLFSFGDNCAELSKYAWWCRPRSGPARVASFKPNKWGLYDMHGNAVEWVSDWYDDLFSRSGEKDAARDPKEPMVDRWDLVLDSLMNNTYYKRCARQGVVRDPTGPAHGSSHVLRGGGWPATVCEACSSGARMPMPRFDRPLFSGDIVGVREATGFRVVREPDNSTMRPDN